MKTRNANALRGFDASRILQRRFFVRRFGVVIADVDDSEILDMLDVGSQSWRGLSVMSEFLADLERIDAALSDYLQILERHRSRLQRILSARQYTDKDLIDFAAGTLSDNHATVITAITATAKLRRLIADTILEGGKAVDKQIRIDFGERLKDIRRRKNLRQVDLADKLGVSKITISSYEIGSASPTISGLYRICQILNCEPNDLLQV